MAGPRGIRSLATDWRGRVAFAASGGRVFERVAGRLVRRPLLPCRVALAAANTTIVYAGGACGAFRSDDAGRTFRRLPAAAGFPIRLVTASPAVHEAVPVAGPRGIRVSRDGGLAFAARSAPPGTISAVGGDPLRPGRLLVVAGGRGYTTSGAGWRAVALPRPVTALVASPRIAGRSYAVAAGRVYVDGHRVTSATFRARGPLLAGPVLVVVDAAGGIRVH